MLKLSNLISQEAAQWVKAINIQIKRTFSEFTSHKGVNSCSDHEKKEIFNIEGNGFCVDCNSPSKLPHLQLKLMVVFYMPSIAEILIISCFIWLHEMSTYDVRTTVSFVYCVCPKQCCCFSCCLVVVFICSLKY